MKAESFNRAERMEIGGGEAQERRKRGVVFPERRCRAGQGCVCGGAGFLFAFGGVQGIIFIRVRPAPSMSTPCTHSKSQSGHRDSETRTKVAR